MTQAYKRPDERRRASRRQRSDAMFWRPTRSADFQMAWLLEESDDGFAFAWRGDAVPPIGSIIEVRLDATAATDAPEHAVMRRVIRAHDDLTIIAAERSRSMLFPRAAA